MKKTYKISVLILLLLLVFSFYLYLKVEKSVDKKDYQSTFPTAQFIYTYLVDNDGRVSTEINSDEYLSESIGLWLYYLASVKDEAHFADTVKSLKKYYLLKNDTVAWRVIDKEKANTNALIDDLRIIKALNLMYEKTQDEDYLKLSKDISQSLMKYNYQDDGLLDFYDVKLKKASQVLTLLYVDPLALTSLRDDDLMSENQFNQLKNLFEKIDRDQVFYPKTYDLKEEKFKFESDVNLIEQLYLAIHLEEFDLDTLAFHQWLQKQMNETGVLYGQYNQASMQASVDYEAPAVYGLAYFYADMRSDKELAELLLDKMLEMKNQSDSAYYGGYITDKSGGTHALDNLIPLIAEEHASHD